MERDFDATIEPSTPSATPGTSETSIRATLPVYGLTLGHGGEGAEEMGEYEAQHALRQLPGIRLAYVSAAMEMAYIEYNPANTTDSQLLAAVQDLGLNVGELNVRSIGCAMTLDKELRAPAGTITNAVPAILTEPLPAYSRAEQMSLGVWRGPDDSGVSLDAVDIDSTTVNNRGSDATGSCLSRLQPIRVRSAVYGASRVIVLGVVLWLIAVALGQPGQRNVYTVEAGGDGFKPVAVVIPANERATLRVHNADSASALSRAPHEFAIRDLGIDVLLEPGETTEIALPPMQPGTYHYYCDVCCGGANDTNMQGSLIVH